MKSVRSGCRHFAAGERTSSESGGIVGAIARQSGNVLARVQSGSAQDVDKAATAARQVLST